MIVVRVRKGLLKFIKLEYFRIKLIKIESLQFSFDVTILAEVKI